MNESPQEAPIPPNVAIVPDENPAEAVTPRTRTGLSLKLAPEVVTEVNLVAESLGLPVVAIKRILEAQLDGATRGQVSSLVGKHFSDLLAGQ